MLQSSHISPINKSNSNEYPGRRIQSSENFQSSLYDKPKYTPRGFNNMSYYPYGMSQNFEDSFGFIPSYFPNEKCRNENNITTTANNLKEKFDNNVFLHVPNSIVKSEQDSSSKPTMELLNAPILLDATPGDRSIYLVWEDKSNKGKKNLSYNISCNITTHNIKINESPIGIYKYTLENLDNGSKYKVKVQAQSLNDFGKSDWSNTMYSVPEFKEESTMTTMSLPTMTTMSLPNMTTMSLPNKQHIIDFIDNFSKNEHFYFSDKNGRKITTMYTEPNKYEVLYVCISLDFLNTIHDMKSLNICTFSLNINSYNLSIDLSSEVLLKYSNNISSFNQNYIIVPIKINTFEQTVNYELNASVTINMDPQDLILNFIQKIEAMPNIYNCLCKK